MSDKYICKYGLYHDKPCRDGEPSSNNGWIYTAYEQKVLSPLTPKGRADLGDTFKRCQLDGNQSRVYFISRLPNKLSPPISRDEIIGMVSLGFDPLEYGWFMYREITKPNYWLAIKTLWRIRKEHRNHFWEQHHYEAFPVAMKLWWHDRFYINKMQGKHNNLFYLCMFNLYALATILQNNISAKNVLTLQLEDMGSKFWIKFINKQQNYYEYFQEGHPFLGAAK